VDGKLTSFGYDGNGNQVEKGERPGWITQTTSYGYDRDNRLRTVTVPVGPPGEPLVQWGTTATASSAYGTGAASWAPSQATGAPDEPGCLASGKSWAPSNYSSTAPEWLRLEYATAAKAVGVKVRENRDAGSVKKVELIDEGGTAHEVWAGTDTTTCGGTLEVKFAETAYRVKAVRLTTGGVAWEEIDAVGLVSAPAPGPTATVGYEYDANGLRTKKSDAAGVTSYLLDGLSVIAEYSGPGARQAWYTQSLARIDEVLSVTNSNGKFWYQADALGSIYALTTAAGDVRARGGYDVFGAPVAVSGTPVGQPFGFTGREHELDSGLVYARARYLNPGTGRWTVSDPLGFIAGPNFYRYVRNDPVSLADPEGLKATPGFPVPLPTPVRVQPARPAPVFDTLTAYAVRHPIAFLALMADLGFVSGLIYAKVVRECEQEDDSLQEFWRGDSASRAWATVTGGFLAAGVGTAPGQLGAGLYMSRDRKVAVRYGKSYSPGAVLDILIRTKVWYAVVAMGAVDGVPIAGDYGTQSFVPTGPALWLFDQASYKIIDEELY